MTDLLTLVEEERIDELLRVVTIADIAEAWCRYSSSQAAEAQDEDGPDWWAIQLWMTPAWWSHSELIRAGLLALVDRVPTMTFSRMFQQVQWSHSLVVTLETLTGSRNRPAPLRSSVALLVESGFGTFLKRWLDGLSVRLGRHCHYRTDLRCYPIRWYRRLTIRRVTTRIVTLSKTSKGSQAGGSTW